MTIAELKNCGIRELVNFENPALETEILLADVLKNDRVYLAIHANEQVSKHDEALFRNHIARRKKNEPASYITGKKEFMSLEFSVSEGILIPRPDTETLVEAVINTYSGCDIKILDLCTGSGAIAVSLAKYLPKANVTAVDISEKCIATARENAEKNGVADRIEFFQTDVLKYLVSSEKYDCIVSNPPYIPTRVIDTLEDNVKKYEPRLALDGGENGLIFYEKIVSIAPENLKDGGMIFFETGHDQAAVVSNILKRNCFSEIKSYKDLSSIERVVSAKYGKNMI